MSRPSLRCLTDSLAVLSLESPLGPSDLADHVEPESGGINDLLAHLRQPGAAWVRGGVGRGKTHLLRGCAAALTSPAEIAQTAGLRPELAGDGSWLTVALDLAAQRVTGGNLLHQVAVTLARAGAALTAGEVEPISAYEWLMWLDSPAAAPWRGTIGAWVRERCGSGVSELRRREGPRAVAELLAEFATLHALAPPTALPVAEKLSHLYEQLDPTGELPVLLLLDNADAAVPEELADLLDALTGDLLKLHQQPWAVVAAAACEPPTALRLRLPVVRLPELSAEVVVGRAVTLADGSPADPDRVVRSTCWALLTELVKGCTTPLALAVDALREVVATAQEPPYCGPDLARTKPFCEWLHEALPLSLAERSEEASAEPADQELADRVATALLLQAAAGRAAEPLLDELARELGPAPLDGSDYRRALAGDQRFELGETVKLRGADELELALFQARAEATLTVTSGARTEARRKRLREAVEGLSREVVYDQLVYPGEIIAADTFEPAWGEILEAQVAFRIVFLTTPTVVSPALLRDARVLVLIPGEVGERERTELIEATAAQQAATSDPSREVREAAARWLATRQRLGERSAVVAYASGSLLADPAPRPNWRETLSTTPLRSWPAALLRPRFAWAHRRRTDWVATDELEETLTSTALAQVWGELTTEIEAAPSAFRKALGLTFDHEPAGFGELQRRMSARGGVLSAPEVLRELTAPPHGLPPEVAALYLLALVLRGEPAGAVEVAGLGPLPVRLDRAGLLRRRWGELRPAQLRRLVRVDARSWSELLPFARALDDAIPDHGSPSAVTAGRARLAQALRELSQAVEAIERALQWLSERWRQALSPETTETLHRLATIATAPTAEAFDRLLDDCCLGDLDRWRADLAARDRWLETARQAELLEALRVYLEAAHIPARHPLGADVIALRGQLDLATLLSRPQAERRLLTLGDNFRRQYREAYREGHRRYHELLREHRRRLDRLSQTAAALVGLNSVAALGPPDGGDAPERLGAVAASFTVCDAVPEVRDEPLCPGCGWRLGALPDEASLARLERDLTAAFDRRAGRLRSLLSAELVNQFGNDRLEALHQVLVLQQATNLPEVLTPETVELLRRCLPSTETTRSPLEVLRERFPTVTAEQLDEVVAEFARLLQHALEEAAEAEL